MSKHLLLAAANVDGSPNGLLQYLGVARFDLVVVVSAFDPTIWFQSLFFVPDHQPVAATTGHVLVVVVPLVLLVLIRFVVSGA